jgi:hypothetical protein
MAFLFDLSGDGDVATTMAMAVTMMMDSIGHDHITGKRGWN